MREKLKDLNKRYLDPPGNTSIAIGTVFCLSSLACLCPLCVSGSVFFMADGIRKKLKR